MLSAAAPVSPATPAAPGKAAPTYVINSSVKPQASPGSDGYTPQQIQTAYQVNQIEFDGVVGNGLGQTIAIVDAFNDPNILPDANYFSTYFGLPQFNAGGPTFQVLNQNGSASQLPPNAPLDDSWDVEESLDVEWVHSIAPEANIILYEATSDDDTNSNGVPDLYVAEQTAAENPAVSVISNSWGGSEYATETQDDSDFTTPTGHQGITFLAAVGDQGSPTGYPATSPGVVAVGGTNLQIQATTNAWESETVWNEFATDEGATAGGPSIYESLPTYQDNLDGINGASKTNRNTPDVSADADPYTGVWVYDSYYAGETDSNPWQVIGGTSLATPLWAGLIGIADQGRVLAGEGTLNGATQTLPMLYSLPASDFHDVVSGNNDTYSAGPGYDLVSGIGTPIANLLVPALAGSPSITAPSSASVLEDGSLTFSSANSNAISVTDGEAGSSADSLALSVSQGTLTLGSTAGLSFTSGSNDSAALTVSGTITNLNAALSGLTYQPATSYLGVDTLSIALSDSKTDQFASASVSLTVGPVTGTWTVTTNATIGGAALDDTMLLPTGQLLTHSRTDLSTWYLYTPDSSGGYINGTATTAGAMNIGVEDFASDVLPNGEVFVVYGKNAEGDGTSSAEMYNPATNSWTVVESDPVAATNGPGNEPSELLNNGDILVGDPTGNGTELYDPTTKTWSTGGATIYNNPTLNEGWVKLPNGDILEYDATSSFLADKFEAELYNPTTNSWSDASTSSNGSTLPLLTAGASMGPAVLLPDGRALFTGVNGVTLFFSTSTDSWTQGPTLPSVMINGVLTQLTETQGPEAVLPDGDVVMELSAPPPSTELFVYDFNPTAGVWTNITPPSTLVESFNLTDFNTMLILPTGQLLLNATSGAQQFAIYTPNAGPQPAWQPTITSFVPNSNGSYTLTGTQLNGLDEGAAFSDGFYQMAEDYPIVQVTDTVTGDVYYATTSDWSLTGVATGSTPETVNVVMPAAIGDDQYSIAVIANGISSNAYTQSLSITAPSSDGATENSPLTFSSANGNAISFRDSLADGNADSATLTVSHGTLTLATTTGLNFIGGANGTSSFTVSGTIADLNAALNGLTYQPTTNYLGSDSLSLILTDPGSNQSALTTVPLTVVPPVTGTWTDMSSVLPEDDAGQLSLLLPDGQLFVHGLGPNGDTPNWYLVTPNSAGSYIDGTWTVAGAMNVGRLYFGSVVLPNGDVFVVGGEYATDEDFSNSAEIYNPQTKTWTSVASDPQQNVGDEEAELLPDGNILVGNIANNGTEIYTPAINANGTIGPGTWTTGPNKVFNDQSDEESWVKLANGDILNYDLWSSITANQFEAELYNPSTNTWSDASNTIGAIPLLSTPETGYELGPALLLPNGEALFTGTNGTTALYNPTTNLWSNGPQMPSVMINGVLTQLTTGDAPGAILPDGDVVLALSPPVYIDDTGEEQFPPPTYIYDLNPTADVWTNISPSSTIDPNLSPYNSYINTMLILPTGQLLLNDDNNQLAIYTPTSGSPLAAWQPTITGFTNNNNGSYTLTGTQLNGLDEGAAYGDDNQMAENYPIVQVTDTSNGNVYYATTSEWSSVGVATGSTPETVNVVLPAALGADPFTLEVIADGIASNSFKVGQPVFTVPSAVSVNENSSLAFTGANTISVSDSTGTAEQATLKVGHGTLNLSDTTGLTVVGNNTGTLTLTGSLLNLNTDLASLSYTPTADYTGADTLTLSDEDTTDGLTGTDSVPITVISLAPIFTAPSLVNVNENASVDFSGVNSITVFDTGGTAEELTLAVREGVLDLATTTGLAVTGNGTGTVTLTGSLSNLNSDLASLSYTPAADYYGPDQLALSDSDTTDNLSGTGDVLIQVNPLAPSIPGPSAVSVDENSSFAFTGGNTISISDPSGTAEQLTARVGEGTLNLATTTGLTVVGNGTAVVTLTGPLATLNSDLATLSYTPTAGYSGADALSLFDKDTADSLTASASVSITVIPPPPGISAPSSAGVAQNSVLVFSSANGNEINVRDPAAASNPDSLTLSVTDGRLSLGGTTGLTVTSGSNDSASFTVSGTIGDLEAGLNGLSYQPNLNYTGSDSLGLALTDSLTTLDASVSVPLSVNAIIPPVITAPASESLSENGSLVFSTANGKLISVADNGAGVNADVETLSVSHGTLTLATTNGLIFQSGFNGTASFTVKGTVSNFNAALNGLTYQPTTGYSGSDSLSISVVDSADSQSSSTSVALTITPLPPVITAPQTASVTEGGSLAFLPANGNTISLADSNPGGDSLTLSVAHGALTLATTSGLSFTTGSNGTASFTVTGSVASLNAALNGVVYQPTAGYSGSDTLAIAVSDSGDNQSASAGVSLSVNAAVAPSITAPNTASVLANASLVFSSTNDNAIFVTDAAAGANTDSLTLSVVHGTLTLATTSGLSFTTGTNDTASFTVTGSVANLNAALNGLTYRPSAGYVGSDSLSIAVSDSGDIESGSTIVALTVVGSVAPSITAPTGAVVSENGALAFSPATSNAISVADSGSGSNSDTLALTVTHGTVTLATTSGLTITAGSNGSASITVTGSVANLNTALNGLIYEPTSAYIGSDKLAISLTDSADSQSASTSVALTVNAGNAPSINAPETVATKVSPVVFSKSEIAITDNNAGGKIEELSLRTTSGTLTLASTAGITFISGANNSASMLIEGTLTNLNAALNGLSLALAGKSATVTLAYFDLGNNLSGTAVINVTLTSGAGGGLGAAAVTAGGTTDDAVTSTPPDAETQDLGFAAAVEVLVG
jgi:hypothetical protein